MPHAVEPLLPTNTRSADDREDVASPAAPLPIVTFKQRRGQVEEDIDATFMERTATTGKIKLTRMSRARFP